MKRTRKYLRQQNARLQALLAGFKGDQVNERKTMDATAIAERERRVANLASMYRHMGMT